MMGLTDELKQVAKILIVDDDLNHIKTVKSFLALEHHNIEYALDGAAGQDLVAASAYDIVILDWTLPDMSGIDFLKWYRRKGSAPVIMLTGKGTIENREEGLDCGADDYLIKPFSARELAARIRALLRRAPSLSSTVVAGKLQLDAKKLVAQVDGTEVHLTQTEFALLDFLARHPEEAFGAQALMTRVWKADSEVSDNALRQTIRRLRAKLGNDIVVAVAGLGYKLGI